MVKSYAIEALSQVKGVGDDGHLSMEAMANIDAITSIFRIVGQDARQEPLEDAVDCMQELDDLAAHGTLKRELVIRAIDGRAEDEDGLCL